MKYAALIKSSFYVPGDERSRTNPGHGYPEYTKTTLTIKESTSKEDLLAYVEKQENSKYGKDDYQLIEYNELKINKSISFDVK